MTLEGKVALITGGNKGIGAEVARVYAAEGMAVSISGRDEDALREVAGEIQSMGGKVLSMVCDVTDPAQIEAMVSATVDKFGAIDVLVNNAGIAGSHKLVDHPDELWLKILDVNLTSVYRVCKAVVPGMIEKGGGRIINMASVASKTGSAYLVAYTASKHGLLGLTRALATELNRYEITVNAICPAYVDTPMTQFGINTVMERTGRSYDDALAYFVGMSPQKRLIEVAEVAHVALMLAGADARGITGQAISIDGGMVMF